MTDTSITRTLVDLRSHGRKALVAYAMAGDPDIRTSAKVMGYLADAGADILELGLPFSDPVADGPEIQAASLRALEAGTNAGKALDALKAYRGSGHRQVPVILMTYLNPILAYGADCFMAEARDSGANGIIVPDLPPEEAGVLESVNAGLDMVMLAAPTSTDSRLRIIGMKSRGFVYMVSVAGVTGTRKGVSPELGQQVARVRRYTDLPVLVGFGIESPDDARKAANVSDGVIIGSAVVKRLRTQGLDGLGGYVGELRQALD